MATITWPIALTIAIIISSTSRKLKLLIHENASYLNDLSQEVPLQLQRNYFLLFRGNTVITNSYHRLSATFSVLPGSLISINFNLSVKLFNDLSETETRFRTIWPIRSNSECAHDVSFRLLEFESDPKPPVQNPGPHGGILKPQTSLPPKSMELPEFTAIFLKYEVGFFSLST